MSDLQDSLGYWLNRATVSHVVFIESPEEGRPYWEIHLKLAREPWLGVLVIPVTKKSRLPQFEFYKEDDE